MHSGMLCREVLSRLESVLAHSVPWPGRSWLGNAGVLRSVGGAVAAPDAEGGVLEGVVEAKRREEVARREVVRAGRDGRVWDRMLRALRLGRMLAVLLEQHILDEENYAL